MIRRFAHPLVFALTLIATSLAIDPISAQDDPAVTAQRIQRIIDRHTNGGLERAWVGCRALEELGDEIVEWAENTLVEGETLPKLMAAKSLISIGAVEKPERIERALRKIGEDDTVALDARAAAIDMLGEFGSSATVRLLERLLDGEAAYDADLRIAAAKALFRCANDYQKSRESMVPLLDVDNPTIRAKAAIALGEMGYLDGRARRILTSLEKEPTALGLQARLLLQQDLLMRRLERMRERRGDAAPGSDEARKIRRLEREVEKKDKALTELMIERDRFKDATGAEFTPLMSALIDRIRKLYVDPDLVDTEELIIAAAKGMVKSLDPFSSFMDAKDYEDFNEGISGEYAGIGAQVAKDPETDYMKILRPIYGGPAYQAGLITDDKIVEVEGLATKGVTLDEIVKKLKGRPDTPVKLKVFRRGWDESRDFEIARRLIRLDSVQYTMLPGALGYLSLNQFGDTAVSEVSAALDALESDGMKGLILDLRDNPGGYLDAATQVVDMFVGKEPNPIVTQKDKSDNFQEVSIYPTPGTRGDYPILVLINESSASASEIVSGALQDYGRATLIGQKTFGKGSVQRLLPLPPEIEEQFGKTRLRLTVQYYYLPSGRLIHTQRDRDGRVVQEGGVAPDIEQESPKVPLWRIAALDELYETSSFERYVDKHFEANREKFLKIAEHGDGGSTDAYPEFDEFFGKYNLGHAETEDIRRVLRNKFRRKAQDERGKEFACDYPEDVQLQRAIQVMLDKIGTDGKSIEEYSFLAKLEPSKTAKKPTPIVDDDDF